MKGGKQKAIHTELMAGFMLWNFLILMCFIAFIIAYYNVDDSITALPCDEIVTNSNSKKKVAISLAYVIFVTFLSILLAFTLIAVGTGFLYLHWGKRKASPKLMKVMQKMFLLVLMFPLFFVTKSILLVIAGSTDFILPLIVFGVLEQCCTAVLLYYIQPKTADNLRVLGSTTTKTHSRPGPDGRTVGKSGKSGKSKTSSSR